MAYIPPTSHVTLLATLRRQRMLPITGEILVQTGQRVEAADVIGRATIPDEHRIKDVGRDLGVPPDKITDFMLKQDGDMVKKGEPIAARKTMLGLGRKESRSPVTGYLVVAGDGKALLAAVSRPFELRAGLPGSVVNVIEGQGAAIENTGALLEGVWGNGQDQFAVLNTLGGRADALTPDQIQLEQRGSILATGSVQDASVFNALSEAGVRGLIVGSLKSELLPAIRKLDFPVMIVEGFGTRGLSAPAHQLLSGNNGREVWLNACAWNPWKNERPEAIIPLPSPGQAPPVPAGGQALEEDRRVRVIRGAEAGQVGKVAAVSPRSMALPSGLHTRVAVVQLDGAPDEPILAALANLEILE